MSSSLDEAVARCRKLYGHHNYVVYIEPCYGMNHIIMAIRNGGYTKMRENFKENTGKDYWWYVDGYYVHIVMVQETVAA